MYSLWFHPLSHFPGPRVAAVSSLPALFWTFKGQLHEWTAEQHRLYGPVVRLRPNELSFIHAAAWKDIYSFRQGQQQMPKVLRTKPINGRPNLMSASDEDHARQRKLLAHAFSDRALRDQEPLLCSYADMLIERLKEASENGKADVDIAEWLTFTTFDIIGDLSFGKSFGNLQSRKATAWVDTFRRAIKQGVLFSAFRSVLSPFWDHWTQRLLGPYVQAKRHEQLRYAEQAVDERLQAQTDRPDFISHCLRFENDLKQAPPAELASMFTIIALAGCESPATALSGTLYYLLQNPGPYKRLRDEVRLLERDEDINFVNLLNMPYLNAVLKEAMRVYPPVPSAMDRVVPGDGASVSRSITIYISCLIVLQIAGHWIPAGTWVGVCQYAANRSPINFTEPTLFAPERYLKPKDERYAGDVTSVVQPFSIGPRNCIGQNLAWFEMRLLLAKLVWHFDLELRSKDTTWLTEQRAYGLWDKEPLIVKLTERKHRVDSLGNGNDQQTQGGLRSHTKERKG